MLLLIEGTPMLFQPGEIVLMPISFDLKSACIALHEMLRFRRPRFCHVGVYVGNGEMITASGSVRLQDAGAVNSIAVPYAWTNWAVTEAWLRAQVGKPYDMMAWLYAALSPLFIGLNALQTTDHAYTCSSLVGQALKRDGNAAVILGHRVVTPDDIARVLGVI